MERLDHIAFLLPDTQILALWERLLARKPTHEEVLESQGLKVYSFQIGAVRIDLMEPLPEAGIEQPSAPSPETNLHHIAFYTEQIEEETQRLKEVGYVPLMESPVQVGMGQEGILLRRPDGLLIELVRFG